MPLPLFIDCDPGADDVVALLLAFAAPELDLKAIATAAGNVPIARTTANARRIAGAGERVRHERAPSAARFARHG
jgi:purine nucleosidase